LTTEFVRKAEEFFAEFPTIQLPPAGSELYQRLELKRDEYRRRLEEKLDRQSAKFFYQPPEIKRQAELDMPEHYALEILKALFSEGSIKTLEFHNNYVAAHGRELNEKRYNFFWGHLVVQAHYAQDGFIELDGQRKDLPQITN
jgi:hypothetical protein